MAGHSKFKNIMFRKGAQDKKRSKLFTKLAKEITVAAKTGIPDPDHNPRLRSAISNAKSQSMPKDNIQRAIEKAQNSDSDSYEEIRYEGYGPGNVALIVDVLTDNRNRTASEVRSAFSKFGGTLGESNSVAFNFQRIGLIRYPTLVCSEEEIIEMAINSGAEDVEIEETSYEIICDSESLSSVHKSMMKSLGEPELSKLDWRPVSWVRVNEDDVSMLFDLLEFLSDSDDVQQISANYEIDDKIMKQFNS